MLPLFFFALLLTPCPIDSSPSTGPSAVVRLPLPPRQMWGWGTHRVTGAPLHGYRGECSFQSVGLYYGNYVSQETVRSGRILLVNNSAAAATALQYTFEEWNSSASNPIPQNAKFLDWAKGFVDNGVPPIAGWFERRPTTDGSSDSSDYDHIMPIVGYETSNETGEVTALYHNNFYLPTVSIMTKPDLNSSREKCRQKNTPAQPYQYCLPSAINYGIALTGIVDENNETFRASLTISQWNEPDWGSEDGKNETPVNISVNATMVGLQVGVAYAILRFDNAKALPSKGFLTAAWTRKTLFTATAETMVVGLDDVLSNGSFFYRVVVDDGPTARSLLPIIVSILLIGALCAVIGGMERFRWRVESRSPMLPDEGTKGWRTYQWAYRMNGSAVQETAQRISRRLDYGRTESEMEDPAPEQPIREVA